MKNKYKLILTHNWHQLYAETIVPLLKQLPVVDFHPYSTVEYWLTIILNLFFPIYIADYSVTNIQQLLQRMQNVL